MPEPCDVQGGTLTDSCRPGIDVLAVVAAVIGSGSVGAALGQDGDGPRAVESVTDGFRAQGGVGDVREVGLDRRQVGIDVPGGVDVLGEWLAVGSVEHEVAVSGAAATSDGEVPVVVSVVMALAEQHEIGHVGASAVEPVDDVVGFECVSGAATGMGAVPVAEQQRAEQSLVDEAFGASEVEYRAVGCVHDGPDAAGAQQSFDDRAG